MACNVGGFGEIERINRRVVREQARYKNAFEVIQIGGGEGG